MYKCSEPTEEEKIANGQYRSFAPTKKIFWFFKV